MLKRKGNTKVAVLGVAGIVSLGIFAYMQLTTTTVYVAKESIMSGTQITEELLSSGAIIAKSVPKSLTNSATVKNFSQISGNFTKYPIGAGQMVYSYDIAGESDVKNNQILREQNLEALTLNVDDVMGGSDALSINDRVNIYGIETIDLEVFSSEERIEIGRLPDDIKEMFIRATGYTESDTVKVGEYKVSKLIAQNVPVAEVIKDTETNKVTHFTMGVTNEISKDLFLSLEVGKIGVNILPYSEDNYKIKGADGTIESLQFVGKSSAVIKD